MAKKSKQKTHIVLILDESGSMNSGKEITVNGFNKQVDLIRQNAKDIGEVTVSLLSFSNPPVQFKWLNQSAESLQYLTMDTYRPQGGTALFDAIGLAVEHLKALDDGKKTTAFLVDMLTDGEENSSQKYTGVMLKEVIQKLQETGRWTFSIMGPRDTVMDLGEVLSIAKGNIAGYDVATQKAQAFDTQLSAKTAYFSTRAVGATASACLYAEESPADKAL